jgi:chromate transporter
VWTSAIFDAGDFGLAAIALTALAAWRLPPYMVVVIAAAGGQLLSAI